MRRGAHAILGSEYAATPAFSILPCAIALASISPLRCADAQRAAQVYCPSCEDIYTTKSRLDGAFFTTSLPHLLMLHYPDSRPPRPTERSVPRIYGYKIPKPKPAA